MSREMTARDYKENAHKCDRTETGWKCPNCSLEYTGPDVANTYCICEKSLCYTEPKWDAEHQTPLTSSEMDLLIAVLQRRISERKKIPCGGFAAPAEDAMRNLLSKLLQERTSHTASTYSRWRAWMTEIEKEKRRSSGSSGSGNPPPNSYEFPTNFPTRIIHRGRDWVSDIEEGLYED